MSTRRPWCRVTVDRINHCGLVAGWNAKELIEQCGGRPLWIVRRRAWSTSEVVAADVVALAQHNGHAVQYIESPADG